MATSTGSKKLGKSYYIEREKVIDDTRDGYEYEEWSMDEDDLDADLDENLDSAVRAIREAQEDAEAAELREMLHKPSLVQRPEVVEDYVRNFMLRMGMVKSLDCFQNEWYELQQRGVLPEQYLRMVPDVYTRNTELEEEVRYLKEDNAKYRDAAQKAQKTLLKLRKERDYHHMHHKRVVQEKNRVLDEVRRIKRHYAGYDPAMEALKTKYEKAMKDKMMVTLERDRTLSQSPGLQNSLKNAESLKVSGTSDQHLGKHGYLLEERRMGSTHHIVDERRMGSTHYIVDERRMGPTHRALLEERIKAEALKHIDSLPKDFRKHPKDAVFPVDTGVNPELIRKRPPGHLTRTGGFRLINTFLNNSHPISGLALHPKKQILATTSDDRSWRIWFVPSGEVILSGEGHTQWVSDCDFHPTGSCLATTSGDATVKIWNLSEAVCRHTFTEHSQPVWSCSWHTCGDFLATASMDGTAKVWDLSSLRSRSTLRGHRNSVNCVQFLPYSNILLTCSADRTLRMWDARTGLIAHTFRGHQSPVNHATFNGRGDTVASCDSKGLVKLWDVRKISILINIDVGPEGANSVTFDPSVIDGDSMVLAIASSDGTVKMHELATSNTTSMQGHEDAVLCIVFDRSGEFVVSGGNDGTVRIWS